MEFHINRQKLIGEVQEEFNRAYPFLQIAFSRRMDIFLNEKGFTADKSLSAGKNNGEEEDIRIEAKQLLWEIFGLSDTMKVSELEVLLQYQFGLPVQIFRKSGNLWMGTRLHRDWTLRQQNDHGEEIASGFA